MSAKMEKKFGILFYIMCNRAQ